MTKVQALEARVEDLERRIGAFEEYFAILARRQDERPLSAATAGDRLPASAGHPPQPVRPSLRLVK